MTDGLDARLAMMLVVAGRREEAAILPRHTVQYRPETQGIQYPPSQTRQFLRASARRIKKTEFETQRNITPGSTEP